MDGHQPLVRLGIRCSSPEKGQSQRSSLFQPLHWVSPMQWVTGEGELAGWALRVYSQLQEGRGGEGKESSPQGREGTGHIRLPSLQIYSISPSSSSPQSKSPPSGCPLEADGPRPTMLARDDHGTHKKLFYPMSDCRTRCLGRIFNRGGECG